MGAELNNLPWHRSEKSAMAVSLGKRILRADFFTLPSAQALNGNSPQVVFTLPLGPFDRRFPCGIFFNED